MNQHKSMFAIVSVALWLVSGCGASTSVAPAGSGATGQTQHPPADTTEPTVKITDHYASSGATATGTNQTNVDITILAPEKIDRQTLEALATTQDNCSDGSVEISRQASIVAITANCENVTVSGSGSIVVAQNVTDLKVNAAGVVVLTKDLKSVVVSSDSAGVLVLWEEGSPSVEDASTGSIVRKL